MTNPTDHSDGQAANVVSIADGMRDLARQKRRRQDPPATHSREGMRGRERITIEPQRFASSPREWTENALGLPAEDPSPVTPLGVEGELFHLIDSNGQFRSLKASDFSHAGMQALYSATPNWPAFHYPRHGKVTQDADGNPKPPPITSFKDDDLRQALFRACSRAGLFSPSDRMRGRGMWTDKAGDLIYHAGEELWFFDRKAGRVRSMECGLHEGYFYPRFPALPAPWTEAVTRSLNPVAELVAMLRSPNWRRPDIDPVLLLGWLGVAYLGGALDWRSHVLLLGDKGTGKSTLQDAFKVLFGDALFHTADTTAAGIYQRMKIDTRPVAVDELEPDADSRKVQAVVQLMRDASSGAVGRRGSSDGVAGEFQMRQAFLFSAINNPVQKAQDLSRVAILRLDPLPPDAGKPPVINGDTCGRMVLAVLMREWPRFEATRAAYMAALHAGGHDARGQKTYGTLLAAADLLIGDTASELRIPMADEADWWRDNLGAASLPEVEDASANWRKCLNTILSSQVEAWRGVRRGTVGQLLEDIKRHRVDGTGTAEMEVDIDKARRDLAETGLGLVDPGTAADRIGNWVLAIPNEHPQVNKLLRGSDWEGGGWKDALRQCPIEGLIVADPKKNRVAIGGVQRRCTLVVMGKYREVEKGE